MFSVIVAVMGTLLASRDGGKGGNENSKNPLGSEAPFPQTKVLPSDGEADDLFGTAVSVSGDIVVAGADGDDANGALSGSAYVFARDGDAWKQQDKLLPNDGEAADRFGQAVSVSGVTVVVGAPGGEARKGCAYVFVLGWDMWKQQAKLRPDDGRTNDYFGGATSVSGDVAVVDAHGDDENGSDRGSAYVFVRDGDTWKQQAKLLPDDGEAHNHFGRAVSLSGDTVVVGADRDNDNGDKSGSAYVFIRKGGAWKQQAKLLPDGGGAGDWFGWAVSLSGDTVVIGAYGDGNSGAAYVFIRDGDTWRQQAKLLPDDRGAAVFFGYAVSLSGDTVVAGAYGDDGIGYDSGSAYVFIRDEGTWSQQVKLLPEDGETADGFGRAVSASGNSVVVGDPGNNDNGWDSGSVHVFPIQ